ncbi:MAG: PilZ domain-containing protein [Acidobacteria bacterium]|nr:PilZ domain-containing protein [Acidobacteriota bacterium]
MTGRTPRREPERVRADLEAHWEGVLAHRAGTVLDISSSGCFILTTDDVKIEELIRLEINLPTGRWIYLWGEVVYKSDEMGFALRFMGGDETELQMLGMLIDYARGK